MSNGERAVKQRGREGAKESGNRWVLQALATAGNKASSEVWDHWTCSKSFSGKKGIKLSHGKFGQVMKKHFPKELLI